MDGVGVKQTRGRKSIDRVTGRGERQKGRRETNGNGISGNNEGVKHLPGKRKVVGSVSRV